MYSEVRENRTSRGWNRPKNRFYFFHLSAWQGAYNISEQDPDHPPNAGRNGKRSRIEGEKTGRIETERDIARKMLAKKLDLRLIKEITGLTEEEIKKL